MPSVSHLRRTHPLLRFRPRHTRKRLHTLRRRSLRRTPPPLASDDVTTERPTRAPNTLLSPTTSHAHMTPRPPPLAPNARDPADHPCTATWFVCTATWLVKWGIVAAATSAALAWLLGVGDGGSSVVPSLIAMVSGVLSGRGQDAAAIASGDGSQRARLQPQAWDSFDEHWEWQFEEQQLNAAESTSVAAQVQQLVATALDAARGGSWLSLARGALQGYSSCEQTGQSEGESRDTTSATFQYSAPK